MEQNKEQQQDNRVLRAKIDAEKGEDYDFKAVAVPVENGQLRYSYQNDEYFMQVMRTGIENIKTDRLERGLPLFDNHPYDKSAANILGKTKGFEFTDDGLVVKCKYGARADQLLRSDVEAGIVDSVSIEGTVLTYEIVREIGKLPVYYATLWEPESLSFAPVPNDIGAKIDVTRALSENIKRHTPEKTGLINSLIHKF